jgi:hypothetical protein
MKSKIMRTLLSLTIMNMIVVLNMQGQNIPLAAPLMPPTQLIVSQSTPVQPGQTLKLEPPQMLRIQLVQSQPTPVITVPVQPGQTLKLEPPQMLRIQLVQSQPTPVITVLVQPGQIIPPGGPEASGTNQPASFTNRPFALMN